MNIPKFRHTYELTLPVYRSVPVVGGTGYRQEKTGETETHQVEVDIDLDKIVHYLGSRAAKSKGRRATNGYVQVKTRLLSARATA